MIESKKLLFEVDLDNNNGPLEILLDLAKSQKVNLEQISITKLADQFHDYISNKKDLNLEIASEYLLMATWLAYLKSKLLLPGTPEEEFKVQEVAEKLKLQLKKLELIRLLSEQMLKRKRLGREIRTRGMRGSIRSIYSSGYKLNLFELLKSYSSILMTKDFQKINIRMQLPSSNLFYLKYNYEIGLLILLLIFFLNLLFVILLNLIINLKIL